MERDSIVMLVAQNIEATMQRKGSNPFDLAKKAGINPTGIYDILSGKSRSPRLDTLHKIAIGLGVPFSALFVEPAEDQLDQDLVEALGQMPVAERQRFLLMARALISQPSIAG